MSGVDIGRQLRYINQWFNEWNDYQRDDFVPVAVEYISNAEIYMNGIISGLATIACSEKPMSLFQCRVKLFREWSSHWPEDMKPILKEQLCELDPKFAEKLEAGIAAALTNGSSTSAEQQSTIQIDGIIA